MSTILLWCLFELKQKYILKSKIMFWILLFAPEILLMSTWQIVFFNKEIRPFYLHTLQFFMFVSYSYEFEVTLDLFYTNAIIIKLYKFAWIVSSTIVSINNCICNCYVSLMQNKQHKLYWYIL